MVLPGPITLSRGLDWVWALMATTVLAACPPGPRLAAALTVHTNPSADTKTLGPEAWCCQHLSQQGPESKDFGPTPQSEVLSASMICGGLNQLTEISEPQFPSV